MTIISIFNVGDPKKEKGVRTKIDESLNMTDYVRVVFKGWASIERALKSEIKVEQVINLSLSTALQLVPVLSYRVLQNSNI